MNARDPASAAAAILATPPLPPGAGIVIGFSREGRPIRAFRAGHGSVRVSVIAGCHADEPVGPRFLRHLCAYLSALPRDDALLAHYDWWIVPHVNPDGEAKNSLWEEGVDDAFDIAAYLAGAVREPPPDDIEFGFPRDALDLDARPENIALTRWWKEGAAARPFALHVTLHGMAFAAGAWFLIEPSWSDRVAELKSTLRENVAALGYSLHDVERAGEKGFQRIERGFCTRPASHAMREHFQALGDDETAAHFRPNSMETVRALGGDPLTLVSELPLFITPGVGEELGPPDPAALAWQERVARWRAVLGNNSGLGSDSGLASDSGAEAREGAARRIREEASGEGLLAMPIAHQMRLQWSLVAAGLAQAGAVGARTA